MPKNYIPSNLIRPYVQKWLDDYETYSVRHGDREAAGNSWTVPTGGSPALSPRTVLCEKTGVTNHTLGYVLGGNHRTDFNTVDRLMCGIGEYGWGQLPELQKFYWEGQPVPPKVGDYGMMPRPFKCQNPECDEWYSVEPDKLGRQDVKRQRYCSHSCAQRVRTIVDFKRRNPRQKKCAFPECGVCFMPIRKSQKYHSRRCQQLHRNRKKGIQSFAQRYSQKA